MLPQQRFRFRRTTLLTVGFITVLMGLGLSRFGLFVPLWWLPILAVPCALVWRKRRVTAVFCVVIFGLSVGLWRGGDMMGRLSPYGQLIGRKVVMQVVATEDAVYGDKTQLTFDANQIVVQKPQVISLPGKVKVAGFGEQMVYRGDVVQIEGKLYKTRGSRQAGVSFAELKVTGRHRSGIDMLRRNFAAGMQNALPEPLASFGLGLLIGQRSGLPDWTSRELAAVGLTHIIAVSGYNLTIIVDMVRRMTARRSKYQGTLLAATLIIVFILMTGFSASIVRAAIVSTLSILAWYYGRTFKPLLLIMMTAAITALWNPLYLWSDIGWYLSFLAFFGVLVLAPLLTKRIYRTREPALVAAVLIETLCAQIMTLPLILYIFQQVSLVSVVSNLLVVPLVPLAMLLAVVAGAMGMWLPAVAGWFAWPARLVLTYILDTAGLLSRLPHALEHYALSLPTMLYVYGLLLGVVAVASHKQRQRGTITDKKSLSNGV